MCAILRAQGRLYMFCDPTLPPWVLLGWGIYKRSLEQSVIGLSFCILKTYVTKPGGRENEQVFAENIQWYHKTPILSTSLFPQVPIDYPFLFHNNYHTHWAKWWQRTGPWKPQDISAFFTQRHYFLSRHVLQTLRFQMTRPQKKAYRAVSTPDPMASSLHQAKTCRRPECQ